MFIIGTKLSKSANRLCKFQASYFFSTLREGLIIELLHECFSINSVGALSHFLYS